MRSYFFGDDASTKPNNDALIRDYPNYQSSDLDIRDYTEISNLQTTDVLEMEPDMKETLLMAVIGVARKQGMKANMPSVTGAEKMVMLGDLVHN